MLKKKLNNFWLTLQVEKQQGRCRKVQ